MQWALGGTLQAQEIIRSADLPHLRLLRVPKNVKKFSAVGFIFGQRIRLLLWHGRLARYAAVHLS
jgi:hypothetical protein